ncbi:MAG TPA: hypothetical protein VMJ10_32285 [Kofleriaceae bacterium]|nr:hypothetical protein [Kofleriaceae bacterium]
MIDTATGAVIGSVTLQDDEGTFLWWSAAADLVIDTARRFEIVVRPSLAPAAARG